MDRVKAFVSRQPVATIGASITALVLAGIGVLNAFQPGAVTPDQTESLVKALAAMWVVLGLIWPTVTPVAAPALKAGTKVKLPDGAHGEVMHK